MRSAWLLALVLAPAGCSNVTSSGIDAALDAKEFLDARNRGPGEPDARAPGPCDALPWFAASSAPSRVLHVVPHAINGDGSPGRPFGSIAAAAAVATPGTFIFLEEGVHTADQFIANLSGTPTAPIWIGGVSGTSPRIANGSEGIHLTNAHYVVIANIEVGFVTAHAITIDDGVAYAGDAGPVAIVNAYVHDAAMGIDATCIKASGIASLQVYDSQIRRCTNGIDAIGVRYSVIARNTIATTTMAVRVRGGSHDVDVRQNRIEDAQATGISLGGFTPVQLFRPRVSMETSNAEARRIRAFNNVVIGEMTAPFAFDDCVDCLVAHNLAWGSALHLLRLLQNTSSQTGYPFEPTRNGRVINNSFNWRFGRLVSHVETGGNVDPSTFTFSHNLWNTIDGPFSTPSLPVAEDGAVSGIGTGYSPMSGLPSAYCGGPEAGRAAPLPEIDGTIEGYCRSAGDAPTIGPQMLQMSKCDI